MHIRELDGKTICILGFGKEGKAMLEALQTYAPAAEITIADKSDTVGLPSRHRHQTGSVWLRNLDEFDVLIKSPGIPPQPEFKTLSENMTSPTQIFLDTVAGTGARVIGVTGSKGKSTTSSLIHAILTAAGKRSVLVGNIGVPAIGALDKAGPQTTFVLELSSYQLMDLTRSPAIAVITAFFPEHLDYHGTLDAYLEAKEHIARYQTKTDTVFYAADSDGARKIAEESAGTKIPFSPSDAPVRIAETRLIGTHNLGNIAAAYAVCKFLKIDEATCIAAIKDFHGLPHRLQSLGIAEGAQWIDDAISTTPESAIAALEALGDGVSVMILGGQDRGYDFTSLAHRIVHSNVHTVILQGESGKRIRAALEEAQANVTFHPVTTMHEAVLQARNAVAQSELPSIVLLSPASPSYDLFKNYEERGTKFAEEVKNLLS